MRDIKVLESRPYAAGRPYDKVHTVRYTLGWLWWKTVHEDKVVGSGGLWRWWQTGHELNSTNALAVIAAVDSKEFLEKRIP